MEEKEKCSQDGKEATQMSKKRENEDESTDEEKKKNRRRKSLTFLTIQTSSSS